MPEPTTRRRGDRYVTRKEDITPLTPEEIEEQREVFARIKELREEISRRRDGVLFPNSWELINEERDKRSAQQ